MHVHRVYAFNMYLCIHLRSVNSYRLSVIGYQLSVISGALFGF